MGVDFATREELIEFAEKNAGKRCGGIDDVGDKYIGKIIAYHKVRNLLLIQPDPDKDAEDPPERFKDDWVLLVPERKISFSVKGKYMEGWVVQRDVAPVQTPEERAAQLKKLKEEVLRLAE